jgi:hypothetical protein
MGRQQGHIVFTGTIDRLCFYKSCGQYCVRKSSSLTGKRVKKSKAFSRTMENAGVLARASRIGSSIYRGLPKTFRQFWMYKAFTGEAIQWLRQGKTDEETRMILWKTYVEIWMNKEACSLPSITMASQDALPDKKKKTLPLITSPGNLSYKISPVLCKHEKEDIVLSALPLVPSYHMVRRRRINRVECLTA